LLGDIGKQSKSQYINQCRPFGSEPKGPLISIGRFAQNTGFTGSPWQFPRYEFREPYYVPTTLNAQSLKTQARLHATNRNNHLSGFCRDPRFDLFCPGFPMLAVVSVLVEVLALSKYLFFANRS
jgi:hypothetical protein